MRGFGALLAALVWLLLVAGVARADTWEIGPDAQGPSTVDGFIDSPSADTTFRVDEPFVVSGWVVDRTAEGWAGIDRIHLYWGRAGEGGVFLGEGKINQPRPDVGAVLGNPFWIKAGFEVNVSGWTFAPGTNVFTVYARTPDRGWWSHAFSVTFVSTPAQQATTSTPRRNAVASIAPFPDDTTLHCFSDNPSCGREAWWAEWDQLQREDPVTYQMVGSRFVTERRFREAVNTLFQWPEGRQLLDDANTLGVLVIGVPDQEQRFAFFEPTTNVIVVNERYLTAPTWLLADVLAHELKHASDHLAGKAQARTSSDCFDREQRAYEVEQRYLNWVISIAPSRLPEASALLGGLASEADRALARDVERTLRTPNVDLLARVIYDERCGG